MAQGITLESFKQQTLNKTYGTPPPILVANSGNFKGQCVSYVRQYCEAVLGIKTSVWGHAIDWWTNPLVLKHFDKVTGAENRKDGDILVWGDDPGNWTSQYGHDAISYGGKILNQNYGNSLKVTVNDFFPQGYVGALRLKGGNVDKITKEQEITCSIMQTGSKPGKNYDYRFTGKDLTQTNLDAMLQFWSRQPRPPITSGEFIPVGELYIKK